MNDTMLLGELYVSLQHEMLEKARCGDVIKHPVDKGSISELNWLDWFNSYFPERYKADKATVIDCCGNTSDQIDVVLYDRQYSLLVFNQNEVKYIPAESVYAVFEVKPAMDKGNMEYAGKKVESVRSLKRTSQAIPYAAGKYEPKEPHHIIGGILTNSIKWKSSYGKSFKDIITRFSDDKRLDIGCALNGGAFFYDYTNNILKRSKAEESLVFFYLQLLNTLQGLGTVPAIDYMEYMNSLSVMEDYL